MGKPREIEKNQQDASYYDNQFDFIIPVADSNEYAEFQAVKQEEQ